MNTSGIIGKRIIDIKQYRPGAGANVSNVVTVEYIELEGGIRLFPLVIEGESEYHVNLVVNRTNAKKRKPKGEPSMPDHLCCIKREDGSYEWKD